jgi:hypothetical protein
MFGNALATSDVRTFTTGISACEAVGAPTGLSVIPANGACPNTAVTATFGEAMDASTINTDTFTVSNATGTVSYDALDLTATFSPFYCSCTEHNLHRHNLPQLQPGLRMSSGTDGQLTLRGPSQQQR